jgi:BirA family transcriptional regulator, biotin operon repressor / biotin---[acetyl-CoA-carboxylase] ligase
MSDLQSSLRAQLHTRWLGRDLVCLGEIASTSDEVLTRARAEARHGLVVIADAQTGGRGRQGRRWHSPAGEGLYLSALLRLDLAPAAAPPLTLAAGVGVCEALRELGAQATLKWPNDVEIGGKKVAGILTETMTQGARLDAIVLGVGVNLVAAAYPAELAARATSLGAEGVTADRVPVAAAILAGLERWIDRFVGEGMAPVAAVWRERAPLLGQRVRVQIDGRVIEGTARDLAADGAFLVDDDAGTRHRVIAGEILPA